MKNRYLISIIALLVIAINCIAQDDKPETVIDIDGNNIQAVIDAVNTAKAITNRPVMIIAQDVNTHPEVSVRFPIIISTWLRWIGRMAHPESTCYPQPPGLQSNQSQEVPCPVTP